MNENKKDLEDVENSFDNVANDLFSKLGIRRGHEIVELYYNMQDLIHEEIRSKFPEGTNFRNF
jgi:tetrahydromethanopterin S-methyltransferase subunit G